MNNRTEIILCVDRSGSMRSIAEDMQGGLATLVAEQAALPGECNITYCRFDEEYEVVFTGKPAAEVNPADLRIVPRGSTALFDAVARTIDDAVARHGQMLSRPDKVLLVIITDGQENASQKFTREHVFTRVEARREAGWDVMFLGANQDAIAVGATLGVLPSSSMNFESTDKSVLCATRSVSAYASTYRSS